MRRVLIICLFLFAFVFPSVVRADAWEAVKYCPKSKGLYDVEGLLVDLVQSNDKRVDIIRRLKSANVCFNRDDHYISDFVWAVGTIRYCPSGYIFPIGRNSVGFGKGIVREFCCPKDKPFVGGSGSTASNVCCEQKYFLDNYKWYSSSTFICDTSQRQTNPGGFADATNSMWDDIKDTNPPLQSKEDGYMCPSSACLLAGDTMLAINFTSTDPVSSTNGYSCLEKYTDLTGKKIQTENGVVDAIGGSFCYGQRAISEIDPESLESAPGIISCIDLKDENEKKKCLDCLANNFEAAKNGEPQSFIYNSLGCIDTRRDQFITRLFQIAFGIFSGLAVVRIMYAAVLMQGDNPEKQQEGREAAIAAIFALVLLAATIPILRYVGINLLNILPSNFLN